MSDFQPGDIVECVEQFLPYIERGQTYTVRAIHPDCHSDVYLAGVQASWRQKRFKLVKRASDKPSPEAMQALLKRLLQEAWMRADYRTADEIADLIGEQKSTEHEEKN